MGRFAHLNSIAQYAMLDADIVFGMVSRHSKKNMKCKAKFISNNAKGYISIVKALWMISR